MPRKNSYITVTDQFCGAGGSSQGVRRVSQRIKGVEVKLAMNHWKLAIETHSTNFPDTMHDCTDVSACDPRRYPSTDILITSPECTNHSLAKGQKQVKAQLDMFDKGTLDPSAERSRATMWDVVRFAEYHQYRCIIVENVVDARAWIPFPAWLMAMHNLGYQHKCLFFNSRHFHPTPQSRDRMYVVFWKKGNKAPDLNHYPRAYCPDCGKDVYALQSFKRGASPKAKYRTQYVYVCPSHGKAVEPYYYSAANIIDWSNLGRRIADIPNFSPNSRLRVEAGLKKYKDEPLIQLSYTQGENQPLVMPMIVNNQHSTGVDCRVKSIHNELPTIPGDHGLKLVTGFVMQSSHSHAEHNGKIKSLTEPLQTQDTRQTMSLVVPFITELSSNGKMEPITEALNTVTAGGGKAALTYYYGGSFQHSYITESIDTVSTKDRAALMQWKTPSVDDCYYRTLRANEIKLAMAFDRDYTILGDSKAQVKQCGNAVTPPVMEFLVERCVESLN